MIMQKLQERNGFFMSKEKIRKIHLIYGCVTAALIILLAVALIVSCVAIYQSGDRPFSAESIASAWRKIAVLGWLCLAAVVGSVILHIALPLEPERSGSIRSQHELLQRYSPLHSELTPEEQKTVEKERRVRRTSKAVTAAAIILLAVYPIIYFTDISHFGVTDLNGDIFRGILVALIPAAAALVLVYLCGRLADSSIRREIGVYQAHPLKPERVSHGDKTNPKALIAMRSLLLAAAVVLIILGIANDGVADVLGKAIRICTECIGLG